jgi:hypothetical protein
MALLGYARLMTGKRRRALHINDYDVPKGSVVVSDLLPERLVLSSTTYLPFYLLNALNEQPVEQARHVVAYHLRTQVGSQHLAVVGVCLDLMVPDLRSY